MRASTPLIIAGVVVVGLIAGFWVLALSPQREEAGELKERVEQLRTSVAEHEQRASAAEDARERFGRNYQRLVVLGKAVPEDADTSSLFVQLDEIARSSGVRLNAIRLEAGSGDAPAPPPQPPAGGEDGGAESGDGDAGDAPVEPVPAMESSVAGLPLGATVGPAGLPVMPYKLELAGTFFEIADFLKAVDALVRPRGGSPRVRGRLLTVDGFSLSADEERGFPRLNASLSLTSFIAPAEEGLMAGATPSGPPPPAPASETTATP